MENQLNVEEFDELSSDHNAPTKFNMLGSTLSKFDARGKPILEYRQFLTTASRIDHPERVREVKGIRCIDEITHATGATASIHDRAVMIYKKIISRQTYRGYSLDDVAVACFYIACRECNAPRSIIELEKATSISRKKLGCAIRLVLKRYDNKVPDFSPATMIGRIIQNIPYEFDNITREKINRAAFSMVTDMMKDAEAMGKNPTSLAATAVYLACQQYYPLVNQDMIECASGISTVTLRQRIKEFFKTSEEENNSHART